MTRAQTGLLSKLKPLFRSPWAMVVAALGIRLALMSFTYTIQLDPYQDHFRFGAEMGRVARSIATGHGFSSPFPDPSGPTAHLTPVYPSILAGVFKLFGVYTVTSALVALTLSNLFSSMICLPVFWIGRRVFGLRVAVWSGWLWAFFPYSLDVSNVWLWETSLTALLLTLLVMSTLRLEQTRSLPAWVGYGLLWGLTALTNPATLSTLPFLGGWVWVRQWRRGSHCTAGVVAASLVFLAIVTPWIWRCSTVYGRFVFFRSNFGLEVVVGNSDTRTPENGNVHPATNQTEMDKLRRIGEPAYMAEKQREAMDFIERQPLRYAGLTLRRVLNTWTGLWAFPPHWTLDELGLPHILTYSFISLLALYGLVTALRNGLDGAVPLAMLVMCFPVIYYLTHPEMRYRHPIDPVLCIFLVYGATSLRPQGRVPPVVEEKAGVMEESIPE